MHRNLKVGILGATGAVGQKFIELLDGHPWFEITCLMASERSSGKPYRDVVRWIGSNPIPDAVAEMVVEDAVPGASCDLVFSGLDASVASRIESDFAAAGYPVISNAKNHRMDPGVPLVIPEVNADHLALAAAQRRIGGGCIVTNPNCSTVGLVASLKPLHDSFGLKAVHVTTMQAVSGAGYPGVASLDILGNVVPWISGEEEKVESEPRKLLGALSGDSVLELDIPISAQCNRVPVVEGHMLSISVAFDYVVDLPDVRRAFEDFKSPIQEMGLPSGSERFLAFFSNPAYPQPARQSGLGGGMTVSVGRLRTCHVLDVRYVALVHNTIRGAAGGAILNAEVMVARGDLKGASAGKTGS